MNNFIMILTMWILIGVAVFLVALSKTSTPKSPAKPTKTPKLSDFVKILLLERAAIDFDDYSRDFHQAVIKIRSMSEIELMGTPEATTVAIVRTFDLGKLDGIDDPKILEKIEAHRGDTTNDFDPEMSIQAYIKYRVSLEHEGQGRDFSKFISTWISIGREYFKGVESGEVSNEWVSRICRPIADISGARHDAQAQNTPDPGSLAMGVYESAMQDADESTQQLLATKMASSAIQAADEFMEAGRTAEARYVVSHFRQHEAFGHLSATNQSAIDSLLEVVSAVPVDKRGGDGRTGAIRDRNSKAVDSDATEMEDLVPGVSAPLITGGKPVDTYICGDFCAVVSTNIESFGPIKYSYVLTVCRNQSESPVMFVTAESNTMAPEIMETLASTKLEYLDAETVTGHFLGMFNKDGHHNLGPMREISTIDGFTAIALSTMRDYLQLVDEPRQIPFLSPESDPELSLE